ncbi:hypothetical protein ACGIF2_08690 [Cellulomonas sp. P22]|uniref:hypothetical protein n=1 Tax=Cellulomonas sp. P22 TaxID=3373189 RepID=UPI0037885860
MSGVQLTSLLRAVQGRTVPGPPQPVVPAPQSASSGPRDVGTLVERAVAAGAPAAVAAHLAEAVADLDERERGQVVEPLRPAPGTDVLRFGTAAARQVDETACGAAVLTLLAAEGDPTVAHWLVTGRDLDGYRSPLLRDVADAPGVAGRLTALQLALHVRSTRRAVLGVAPWPTALGTPPWGAARTACFPGVRYRAFWVDDTRPDELGAVLALARQALGHGLPVPVYTGGDTSRGLAAALPRHVVLLTAADERGLHVYEPSGARLHVLPDADLLDPGVPRAAYGHWSHVTAVLLPRPGTEPR